MTEQRSHHGFVNAVHVVHVQAQLLARLLDDRSAMSGTVRLCELATSASRDRRTAEANVDALVSFGSVVLDEVAIAVASLSHAGEETVRELREIVEILATGLVLAELRIQELLYELGIETRWEELRVEDFVGRIQGTIGVLCLDRRHHVVYGWEDHRQDSHLVEIAVTSRAGDLVCIPSILARLLAYHAHSAVHRTKPGGRVLISLIDEETAVIGSVRDNGRPIAIDGLDDRVRSVASTGDPYEDGGGTSAVDLAVAGVLAARADGSCTVGVSASAETEVRISFAGRRPV